MSNLNKSPKNSDNNLLTILEPLIIEFNRSFVLITEHLTKTNIQLPEIRRELKKLAKKLDALNDILVNDEDGIRTLIRDKSLETRLNQTNRLSLRKSLLILLGVIVAAVISGLFSLYKAGG